MVLPHLDAAYRLARWLSGSSTDADDVVQEAILRAYRGFDALRGEDAKAWLLVIVRNCHRSALQQRRRRPSEPLPEESDDQDVLAMTASSPGPEEEAVCVEVSPAVADFASQGFRLTGGRVDYLEHRRAAVTVYQHGAHIINVFCWIAPHGLLPGNATRHGYHMVFWRSGDLAYAAVSDTGWDELAGLERLLRHLAANDSPPNNPSPN